MKNTLECRAENPAIPDAGQEIELPKSLINKMSQISREEPELLYYSPQEIEKLWKQQRIIVYPDVNEPEGFIFKIPIMKGWTEITGLYTLPSKRPRSLRQKSVAERMVKTCMDQCAPGERLITFTQIPGVARFAQKLGSQRIGYFDLPLRVLLASFLEKCATPARLWELLLGLPRERNVAVVMYTAPDKMP
ncbi:GNAT family N-acetyltransferase [Thiothrix nivea]|uniref:Uncharacterized protein n=1 Tax=Thiothrix nivea (strain ATCC 35100 / DSM 5205 / JP2) TaxID=870187 RepID=A0A656HLB1_THINJ|nr:GNAT family N-acetyltransferase [Thiothrix nivea]EIJ36306.1 hypothetical protein Thini_3805 [Thiothrix nivea DSM 5205]